MEYELFQNFKYGGYAALIAGFLVTLFTIRSSGYASSVGRLTGLSAMFTGALIFGSLVFSISRSIMPVFPFLLLLLILGAQIALESIYFERISKGHTLYYEMFSFILLVLIALQ